MSTEKKGKNINSDWHGGARVCAHHEGDWCEGCVQIVGVTGVKVLECVGMHGLV